jgi:hypothetical protein
MTKLARAIEPGDRIAFLDERPVAEIRTRDDGKVGLVYRGTFDRVYWFDPDARLTVFGGGPYRHPDGGARSGRSSPAASGASSPTSPAAVPSRDSAPAGRRPPG